MMRYFSAFIFCVLIAVTALPVLAQDGLLSNPGGRDRTLLAPQKSAPKAAPAPGEVAPKAQAKAPYPEILLPGEDKPKNLPEMWGNGPDAKYMADPLKHPIFLALSPEMQDAVLAETETYFNSCTRLRIHASMHDCTCLSMKFFIQRLENPEMAVGSIHDRIRLQCVDKASIAGTYYERCLRIYKNMETRDLNKRCECYGRNMADIYSRAPNDNMYGQIDQGVLAMQRCKGI